MGTGKTLTALCVMYYFATIRSPILSFIVICPDSIKTVWDNEINDWNVSDSFKNNIHIKGYLEVLDWHNLDTKFKQLFPHSFVVLDEAHRLTESNEITGDENIIDNEALEKREVKGKKQKEWIQLISSVEKAKRILMLTGTPVYRSAFDLVFLINILSRNKTGNNIFPNTEIVFNSKFMVLDKIKKATRGTLSPLLGTLSAGTVLSQMMTFPIFKFIDGPYLQKLFTSAVQMFSYNQYMKIYTQPTSTFVWNYLHRQNLITALRPYIDHYNLSDFVETESEFPWKKFKFEFIPYNCKQLIASASIKLSNVD